MKDLQLTAPRALALAEVERRRQAKARSLAPSSQAGYNRDFGYFMQWCASQGRCSMPAAPETVSDYLDASPHKVATLRRHVAAIAAWHDQEGHPNPCLDVLVRGTLKGLARERGTDQKQARGLVHDEVVAISALTGDTLKDLRDVALMRVGRDLLARAGELVSLTVEMIAWDEDGTATVSLRRFKTATQADSYQLGEEATQALRMWLTEAAIATGPVWRSLTKGGKVKPAALTVRDVGRILRSLGERVGAQLSGHSLRVGMAQDLVSANFETNAIMQAGGWGSSQMVARYARRQRVKDGAVAQYYAKKR
jgi:integrase